MPKNTTGRFNPPTSGLNILPFAAMAGGWLAPLVLFWLYVWGPLRPFDYPGGYLLPEIWFLLLIAACFALNWVLPKSYFQVHSFEKTGDIYRSLGVLVFRRFVPDGDLANMWVRRKNPSHRLIRGRQSASEFISRTEQSERSHLVLLALGLISAIHAWSIGWEGWAVYLGTGNIVVNVYPVLLQRYTRSRLISVLK